jgi:hypothetical protein
MTKRTFILLMLATAVASWLAGEVETTSGGKTGTSTNAPVYLTGYMSRTKVIQPDQATVPKLKAAKSTMRQIRAPRAGGVGPWTIQEAAEFLRTNVNMACPPGACVEYEGIFFFSGGTSTTLDTNFISGFAIKKGDTAIFEWEKEREGPIIKK